MTSKFSKNPLSIVVGAAFAIGALPVAAGTSIFQTADLGSGYQLVAEAEKAAAEGKCGEGKCGGEKKHEEGKCGEGKCGGDKKATDAKAAPAEDKPADANAKHGEGKCGEGKCGGAK